VYYNTGFILFWIAVTGHQSLVTVFHGPHGDENLGRFFMAEVFMGF
jgi:hypothetical protein